MKLFDALNLSKKDIVALVGGGGKTSTMYALGREAAGHGLKTVLTTTTRISCPRDPNLPIIATRNNQELFARIGEKLANLPVVVAGAERNSDNKLLGLDPNLIPELLDAGADLIIVEADGAARKPFKAPADHEPVIPEVATVVIPIVGIDCLNRPLLSEYIHRPEIAAPLGGISLGERITPEVVARILTHPDGFRKNLPENSRWIPFINKVETDEDLKQARIIAKLIGEVLPCRVIIGAVREDDPVTEILNFDWA